MKHLLALVAFSFLVVAPAAAQEPTLEKTMSKKVRQVGDKDKFLTFNFENDMLGGGTDQNYTSGVRATYFDLGMKIPEWAKTIDFIVPTFGINETTSIYYSFGHNLYTPRDITQTVQPANDRPWAAFLYASAGLSSITDNHIDNVEATIGVVGPMALGEPIQKFVHKHISDSAEPMGWDNQLENEPALMLSWERSWPNRWNFNTLGWTGALVPHAGVTLGNIYTYANGGVSFRLSPFDGRFQDDPIRVRPSMPGTGAFIVDDQTFTWYFFGGVEGRAVARNIFLDGNTFESSHSVDKKPLVMDATAGLALTYGQVRISYAAVYRTKEFDDAENGDVFGTVSVGLRF
jgi:hypothetical protein